jgi:hypothetical protein
MGADERTVISRLRGFGGESFRLDGIQWVKFISLMRCG